MSEMKNSGLDQYGTGPFKQQQFGTAGGKGANTITAFSKPANRYNCSYE